MRNQGKTIAIKMIAPRMLPRVAISIRIASER